MIPHRTLLSRHGLVLSRNMAYEAKDVRRFSAPPVTGRKEDVKRMKMRVRMIWLAMALLACCVWAQAQERVEAPFPNVGDFLTLKCDFHMHTVFSDGHVWPTVRVREAWRNGLDAISITDHIEYLPHKGDLKEGVSFNRPYEIALPEAVRRNMILIRGAEITRDEPHGHFNAIFLTDCDALDTPDQRDAVRIAAEQGAFLFWNHPEWKRKGYEVWGEIHEDYLENGWIHGIEVYNGRRFHDNAHRWAAEKGLAMLANTDVHVPIDESYDSSKEYRDMTLVFATERSEAAIKEALFAGRVVAFSANRLVGPEEWVRPLVEASIDTKEGRVTLRGADPSNLAVHNSSALPLELKSDGRHEQVSFPQSLTLPAGKTVMMSLRRTGMSTPGTKTVLLPFTVANALVAPETGLDITIEVEVTVTE